ALNQRGEVVGVYRILRILTERKAAREKGKYADIQAAHYATRGASMRSTRASGRVGGRSATGTTSGRAISCRPMVKGPLTVTEIIAFHAGGYGFVPYGLWASRVGYKIG